MTEPKRRGRPPKAKPCEECGQTVGHYDDCPVGMGVVTKADEALMAEKARESYEAMHPEMEGIKRSQEYALRVWNGQSATVPRSERLRRVAKALEGQGLSMEGVEL